MDAPKSISCMACEKETAAALPVRTLTVPVVTILYLVLGVQAYLPRCAHTRN